MTAPNQSPYPTSPGNFLAGVYATNPTAKIFTFSGTNFSVQHFEVNLSPHLLYEITLGPLSIIRTQDDSLNDYVIELGVFADYPSAQNIPLRTFVTPPSYIQRGQPSPEAFYRCYFKPDVLLAPSFPTLTSIHWGIRVPANRQIGVQVKQSLFAVKPVADDTEYFIDFIDLSS